jgi:ankyrin repeat protein
MFGLRFPTSVMLGLSLFSPTLFRDARGGSLVRRSPPTTLFDAIPRSHSHAPTGVADIRRLLDAGADPNAKDEYGQTPLILAAWAGDLPSVRELLRRGAHANARNRNGDTALIVAAAGTRIEVAKALLAAGADPDARNKQGKTALSVALGGYNGPVGRLRRMRKGPSH